MPAPPRPAVVPTFTTQGSARDHFGAVQGSDAGCLIDRVAIEEGGKPERGRGLLMALRKAEDRIAELVRELDKPNSLPAPPGLAREEQTDKEHAD